MGTSAINNPFASRLIELVRKESIEILYDRDKLSYGLTDYFSQEEGDREAFELCHKACFFPHAYYKTNISEILFMRNKTIGDLREHGVEAATAKRIVEGFIGLAESLRGIDILGMRNESKEKTYELLSAAVRSYEKGNFKPALIVFNSLSTANMPEALYYMGKCHFDGKALPQDSTKAAKFFMSGLKVDSSYCCYHLGSCLLKGNGVKRNMDKGTEFLIKAADMGQEDACFAVGFMHKDGALNKDGMVKSPDEMKKAIKYLQIAADYGNWSAAIAICDLYYEDAKTSGNFHKTSEARERLAKASDPESCYKIAQIYELGIGIPANMEKALNFSTRAAAKGHKAAQEMMARVGNTRIGK